MHGLPFRGPGETDPEWWGGYCWHDTILFPTWHRAYLLYIEDALRSIEGCEDVTLPFWDELLDASDRQPIPKILTSPTFLLDGRSDNPLFSYKLQKAITNKVEGTGQRYTKPEDTYSIVDRYYRCLFTDDYTLFSNTASQNKWIKDHPENPDKHFVVSLESPHNALHLAIGGFYQAGVFNADPILGANGDMGDNETAGFDPLFFFHHSFVDYVLSIWQIMWRRTKRGNLTIRHDYPGTFLEIQGQPPNYPLGTTLNMTTPLRPFRKQSNEYYTSNDVTDLHELGIEYGSGSLDSLANIALQLESPHHLLESKLLDATLRSKLAGANPYAPNPFVLTKRVHNINRADYPGSFVIRLYARGHDGKEAEVSREAVLSRWNIQGCQNCQNHLDVDFFVPLDAETLRILQGPDNAEIRWRVVIQTHPQLHNFPIGALGDPGGRGKKGPQVDDL
ncbi:hypothetical protein H0H87_001059 [Tephrocybe sp. NHM501043]|nr:hypothetical protein H0H87_001059 [Tephrocybe sp. NHM501043]